jgi:hypothetical protein
MDSDAKIIRCKHGMGDNCPLCEDEAADLRKLEEKLQRMGYDLEELDRDNPYCQYGDL